MRLALSAILSFSTLVSAPLPARSEAPTGTPAAAPAAAPASVAAPAAVAADDCSRARTLGKTCVLTLGAEEVQGGVMRPQGEQFAPRPFSPAGSLIRLRRDFVPEILSSAAAVD